MDKLQNLREEYKATGDKKRCEFIKKQAERYKAGEKFGGVHTGGNGYCYLCLLEKAREEHYSCRKCAGLTADAPKTTKRKPDIQEIQKRLKVMGKEARERDSQISKKKDAF